LVYLALKMSDFGAFAGQFLVKNWSRVRLMSEQTRNILEWLSGAPLRVLIVIVAAWISYSIGHRAIDRAINKLATADLKPGPGVAKRQAERARTTGSVLNSILKAIIWIIAIGMILGEFGFNLGPVIASAGVIGVAIGLGAQTLVRDILSGIFMLIEDQYGVGDQIKVLEIEGVVEKVGLRITTVRDKDDVLWYVRNGEILVIGNGSQKS
jgi:small-conductance mechanosensitive channel